MTRETIELQYPVTHDGEEVSVLHLRRPRMRDMKKQQRHKDDLDKAIAMLADLAEVTPGLIEELDPIDFAALSDWVGKCMPDAADAIP